MMLSLYYSTSEKSEPLFLTSFRHDSLPGRLTIGSVAEALGRP